MARPSFTCEKSASVSPQGWAAKIHHDEGDEKEAAIIIRNVPESVRRDLKAKAALEGKPMQALILELITRYINS